MDLFGNHARELKRVQKEVAAQTRTSLQRALGDVHSRIANNIMENVESILYRLQSELVTTLRERYKSASEKLATQFQGRTSALIARSPQKLINDAADAHRRTLVNEIGKRGMAIFRDRTEERMGQLVESIKKSTERADRTSVATGPEALPQGTRFFYQWPDGRRAYVIEQSPTVRTLDFRGERYRLALPYVVFVVRFSEEGNFSTLDVFFRNEPLQTETDLVAAAALPNQSPGGGVCFPHPRMMESTTYAQKISAVLDNFWGSTFNNDSSSSFERSMRDIREIKSLSTWQANTRRDSRFVLTLRWLAQDSLSRYVSVPSNYTERQTLENAVRQSLEDVSVRVGQDVVEAAAEMIGRWRIDQVPSEIISAELKNLLTEGSKDIEAMLDQVVADIFPEKSGVQFARTTVTRMIEELNRETDRLLGWIGINRSGNSAESHDLRHWRTT